MLSTDANARLAEPSGGEGAFPEGTTLPRLPPRPHPRSEHGFVTVLRLPSNSASRPPLAVDEDARSGSFGALPRGEQRALLQSGVVLWARINALILLGIIVLTCAVRGVNGSAPSDLPADLSAPVLMCAYFVVVMAALRYLRLELQALRIVDAVAVVLGGVGFAVLMPSAPGLTQATRDLIFQLTTAHLLMIRAGVVASSGRKTQLLGMLATVPGLVACALGHWTPGAFPYQAVLDMAARCGATILASTLASRRIYGLERQVQQARRLGQYTLQEKIGAGGMGVVYKASHALLRRPTAIKLMNPDDACERSLLQFEREAQLTSELTHPSTIQIYDFGRTDGGVFYFAMEYLEGLTLHDLIVLDGPQPASRTISLLLQVCGSLAEAHAVGLVHRDIKPANIMVCERGRVADVVKVLDFGLAKKRQKRGVSESSDELIVGTPAFMAPEAILSPSLVDGRSDIYAVGAVAYFLITGQQLFEDAGDLRMLVHQLHSEPVLPSVRLGAMVPGDLEQLIRSCLHKDIEKRPQSSEQLSKSLRACRDATHWPQEQARTWWDAHRDLLQHRRRPAATNATASLQLGAPVRAQGARERFRP